MYNERAGPAALLADLHRRQRAVLPAALPGPRRHAAPLCRLSRRLRLLELVVLGRLLHHRDRHASSSSSACSTPTSSRARRRRTTPGASAPPRSSGPALAAGVPLLRDAADAQGDRASLAWPSPVGHELAMGTTWLKWLPASTLRPAHAVGGSIGDFVALMKPRVMSLVVFTALVGMVLAPRAAAPGARRHRPHLHRRRRRSLRRAQHVVRRRHRRADAAHGRPADPARSTSRPTRRSPSAPSSPSARSPPSA